MKKVRKYLTILAKNAIPSLSSNKKVNIENNLKSTHTIFSIK